MAVSSALSGKECPLCLEPFDADDLSFFPCHCEYQVCRFCWHRIRTDENGLCPACRAPYPENPVNFEPVASNALLLARMRTQRRKTQLQRRQQLQQHVVDRSQLADLRIVPRNLIVVMGLPSNKAKEDVLRRAEYFGQFGKILKVALKCKPPASGSSNCAKSHATAFVTFQKEESAFNAVCKLDNVEMDGQSLRVTLGTTKYCSFFLRGQSCYRADCLYMHQPGDPAARFTADEIEKGCHVEYQQKLISDYLEKSKKSATCKRDAPDQAVASAALAVSPQQLSAFSVGDVSDATNVSTERLASSWDAQSTESSSLDPPDPVTSLNLNLTPFSLPVYGQSMMNDPQQPVIHIGHDHHDHYHHDCCSGMWLDSELDMADLNFSLSEGLRICNDRTACSLDGGAWDACGGGGGQKPTARPSLLGGGGGHQRRHRSRSEVGSFKRCGGEPPPAPNHWFQRPGDLAACRPSLPLYAATGAEDAGRMVGIRDAVSFESPMAVVGAVQAGRTTTGDSDGLMPMGYSFTSGLSAVGDHHQLLGGTVSSSAIVFGEYDPFLHPSQQQQQPHQLGDRPTSYPFDNVWR